MEEVIIDLQAINIIRDLDPDGGGGFLNELIHLYLSDTDKLLLELQVSLATGEAKNFTRAAHTIKGSSGNVGATQVQSLAGQLEQLSKEGLGNVQLPEVMSQLKAAYAQAEVALRSLLT
jgi:HPt (histidine-containing phosphotransfer) domain-containing protein